ncbi:Crp/Fnr family transcriptional regulator [uncultured Thiodictyon sp.]|uniref:Crp/Fnr family transcriptional regulator n=1 Tax=uncultured Thiodictyon sp. TaxID=1846217 RepID=UPI0025FEF014|nr:Crp/Fnr family transcriptional regulator [uncultured Thiodictyon sp.]
MPETTWHSLFPTLAAGDLATRALIADAKTVEVASGQPVFHAGASCSNYVLVVAGSIRVQVIGQDGREALLYRVLPGEACVLTTCCILSGDDYPAAAYTESPVTAVSLSKPVFDRALEEAPTFRRFVFTNLGARMTQVIARMEELAFRPIDRRLVDFLLLHTGQRAASPITATHQDIAVELGTAREVVSRHLKRLETAGLVRLARGSVEILDRGALTRIGCGPL